MIVSYITPNLSFDDSQMDSQRTSLTENSSGSHPRTTYLNTIMLPHHHTLINLIWNTGKTVDSSYLGEGPLTQTIITITNLNPSQLTVKDSPLSPWTRSFDYLTTKSRCTGGPHISLFRVSKGARIINSKGCF